MAQSVARLLNGHIVHRHAAQVVEREMLAAGLDMLLHQPSPILIQPTAANAVLKQPGLEKEFQSPVDRNESTALRLRSFSLIWFCDPSLKMGPSIAGLQLLERRLAVHSQKNARSTASPFVCLDWVSR